MFYFKELFCLKMAALRCSGVSGGRVNFTSVLVIPRYNACIDEFVTDEKMAELCILKLPPLLCEWWQNAGNAAQHRILLVELTINREGMQSWAQNLQNCGW